MSAVVECFYARTAYLQTLSALHRIKLRSRHGLSTDHAIGKSEPDQSDTAVMACDPFQRRYEFRALFWSNNESIQRVCLAPTLLTAPDYRGMASVRTCSDIKLAH